MSPFWNAHKINEPILLIHGEADDNSGTFPIQSERLYMAIKGHVVAETIEWFDKHVKNAKPRNTTTASR